ncbi:MULTISPECIES: DUF5403 family protein [unclassified Aeromicrobium]|uniref:DUF5403 family protein n=1 Tax=unclassified Aeromicrobium TaxID=2633570 RepID=UPI00288B611B|nr:MULTISPECIES: DUF5403 family protein [unclassified Aeromicrobium]
MAGSRVYSTINGVSLEDYIAHLPGVKNAVADEARRVTSIAKAIAAAEGIPKGHRVTQGLRAGITDSYIYFSGPFVEAVEFGRNPFVSTKVIFMPPDDKFPKGRFVPKGTYIAGFPGKHILRRAWEQA